MTSTQIHLVEQLANGGGVKATVSGTVMLGGRTRSHESTAFTRQRTRFAANPATQIPLSRIEQYSRFKSTPIIHQTSSCRESDVELRILPTSLLTRTEGPGVIITDPHLGRHQPPKYMPATRSAPQLTAEQRMAGATELSTPVQQSSSRRLSFSLTRTGTRQSDRVGRRLSTTSSHDTAHSWHGTSGILASLPTPNLLSSLAGAAHYTGNPKVSKQETVRASFGPRDVILEDQRKQIVEDVLEVSASVLVDL
ncbi:hypothetical protein BDV93DRAFT_518637 [Ceratobasidium sp. AG-I]|nr:hypothetical protein BDV93DRAFT_518637 [Ceratobasidium sp. AG-I]